jgi:hypothetical protein
MWQVPLSVGRSIRSASKLDSLTIIGKAVLRQFSA